jgi:hypothetical protein
MKGSRYVVGGKGIRAYLMVFCMQRIACHRATGTSTRCFHPSPWVASARPGSGEPVLSGCERRQNGFGEPVDWPLLGGGCGGSLSHTH